MTKLKKASGQGKSANRAHHVRKVIAGEVFTYQQVECVGMDPDILPRKPR